MPKLPVIKPRIIIKFLKRQGFTRRKSKSSHQRYIHIDGRKATIPYHNRPLKKGTLKSILRQVELSVDDLLEYLRKK